MKFKIAAVISTFLFLTTVSTQAKIKVQAVRLSNPVIIDGILNESVWQSAPIISGFLQRDPDEGKPSSQQTYVRVAYDDDALYVGADMKDSAPDSIVARLSRRDNMANEDGFGIFIDSYYDRRSGFYFGLTAGGTILDGILYNDDWDDSTWDGVWQGHVSRNEEGWTAEFRIPFSQLRFQKKDHYVWGINFRRDISRRNEQTYLVFTPKNSSGFVSRFPDMVGIENIKLPTHIEALPFIRTRAEYTHPEKKDPFHEPSFYSLDMGIDLKVGLSNNLTMDMTVNPDFGQVEIDPAVVNLSDIEIYFYEKRPFFIEGTSTFNFGAGGANSYWNFNWPSPTLFYSRRIGRYPQRSLPDNDYTDIPESARIISAAKLSGKLPGNWNIGTIHALTRREFGKYSFEDKQVKLEVEPLTYYGIFRTQKEINDSRQGIGIMSTVTYRGFKDNELRSDINDNAVTFGIDGWTFLDTSKTWVFTGWTAGSHIRGTKERILELQTSSSHYFQRPDAKYVSLDSNKTDMTGFAGRFYLNKQKGNVIVNSAFGFITPEFDINDAGFLSRTDIINYHFGIGYLWTKPGKVFRNTDLIGAVFQNYDFDWNLTWSGIFLLWEMQFLNYMSFDIETVYVPETINTTRTRGGPLTLNHKGFQTNFYYHTDDRKPLVFNASFYRYICRSKDDYHELQADLEWKPASNINLSIGPSFMLYNEFAQWIDVFDDSTAARTYGKRYVFGEMKQTQFSANIRLNWTFTPRLSLQLYLQPLISHADYENIKELNRPKSYTFDIYPDERITKSNGKYEIDPDGPGPVQSFTFDNPDFFEKSFNSYMVLRWEFKPGSTLYLVWTQNRLDDTYYKSFSFYRSAKRLWNIKSDNTFIFKLNYWWNF